jgi:hypothetical protein
MMAVAAVASLVLPQAWGLVKESAATRKMIVDATGIVVAVAIAVAIVAIFRGLAFALSRPRESQDSWVNEREE